MAGFDDSGRSASAPSGDTGLLRDAGVGLPLGSPRSPTGPILHVDPAWPLDGPQDIHGAELVIEARTSF